MEMQRDWHTFAITGMTCGACAARIEKGLLRVEGVQEAHVNLATGRAAVGGERGELRYEQIEQKVRQLGFGVEPVRPLQPIPSLSDRSWAMARLVMAFLLTLPLLLLMLHHAGLPLRLPRLLMEPWVQLALATPIQFLIGHSFYKAAWRALRHGGANMDVLIALGTSSAYFYSLYQLLRQLADPDYQPQLYVETSSIIITIVLLGRWLESSARKRSMSAISKLQELQQSRVEAVRDGRRLSLSLHELSPGDELEVRPGGSIPVDGIVLEGMSSVDEAMMTGEAVPVAKSAGHQVIAGTINQEGRLRIEAVRPGSESSIARLIGLLETAQSSKPPIQRRADELAELFVPLLCALAAVTFLFWIMLIEPGNAAVAMERMISVLIVACPCAIGLATPISVLVGSGRAAQKGVLYKEGRMIEALHRVTTVLLDKTGTVTEGRPVLTGVHVLAAGMNERELLELAAAAERHSEHPLGQAIVRASAAQGGRERPVRSFRAVPGFGVQAVVAGSQVMIGSWRLVREHVVPQQGTEGEGPVQPHVARRLEAEGHTVLYMLIDRRMSAVLAVRDVLRRSAKEGVRELGKLGLSTALITGDHARTAQRIAEELSVGSSYAEASPGGKLDIVRELQRRGERVLMVGDGMNDAPALAAADVGMALASGTDLSKEAADISLLGGNLLAVAEAIRMSRRTMTNIHQNLTFALVYNGLAIPFAAIGWLEPWMACSAMALSSLTVVGNALRLQRM